jgi:hypothetical protein
MVERRKRQRWPTYWAGHIRYKRSGSTADCLVRNSSEHGVKLLLRGAVFVPREFELNIPKYAADYRAKVIWRRSEELGVVLERIQPVGGALSTGREPQWPDAPRDQAPKARSIAVTPMGLVRRLKKLRQEYSSLRRQLLTPAE